ncbi:MAG TPA: phosphatidate cytidylyltransferase [Gemmatimonadales bacterium]|jgi:phosphatidate cytidylyltransferase|nr:phosphatidate cytidylyltransferase [Gemmatimonadales bacterium]
MDSNLVRRIGFAVVAIPVAFGLIWFGGWPLVAVVALVGLLGTRELFDIARRQRIEPAVEIGLITVLAFAPVAYMALSSVFNTWWVLLEGLYGGCVWLMGLLAWALWKRGPQDKPLSAVAVTLFGVVYAGLFPTFLVVIRHDGFGLKSGAGTALVFFPLIVTWICDTAAMFGGRIFKGPKLAPTVSPGKTRSGAICGVVGGIAVAPLYGMLAFQPVGLTIPIWQLLVCAGVWSVIGQVGDLAESLFKREAGLKDSSNLIPGHGGVLDRFDSLYFVLPTAVALYKLLGIQ